MKNKQAWLRCHVLNEEAIGCTVKSWLVDESEFTILVNRTLLDMIPNTNPQTAWLKVDYHGEQNKVASITLPTPSLNYGAKIVISTKNLLFR